MHIQTYAFVQLSLVNIAWEDNPMYIGLWKVCKCLHLIPILSPSLFLHYCTYHHHPYQLWTSSSSCSRTFRTTRQADAVHSHSNGPVLLALSNLSTSAGNHPFSVRPWTCHHKITWSIINDLQEKNQVFLPFDNTEENVAYQQYYNNRRWVWIARASSVIVIFQRSKKHLH